MFGYGIWDEKMFGSGTWDEKMFGSGICVKTSRIRNTGYKHNYRVMHISREEETACVQTMSGASLHPSLLRWRHALCGRCNELKVKKWVLGGSCTYLFNASSVIENS
jgi:hypothetical protein